MKQHREHRTGSVRLQTSDRPATSCFRVKLLVLSDTKCARTLKLRRAMLMTLVRRSWIRRRCSRCRKYAPDWRTTYRHRRRRERLQQLLKELDLRNSSHGFLRIDHLRGLRHQSDWRSSPGMKRLTTACRRDSGGRICPGSSGFTDGTRQTNISGEHGSDTRYTLEKLI